jgi:hypothetical protein
MCFDIQVGCKACGLSEHEREEAVVAFPEQWDLRNGKFEKPGGRMVLFRACRMMTVT